jgi:hypothetical protein
MVATTYGGAGVADVARPKAVKKGKGFFARLFDAVAETQMKRAERELALHRHLLPDGFELQGKLRSEEQEPFGGW